MVVAAGSGRRFGAPKQFQTLGPGRVVDRSVQIAAACCDGVVVVLPAEALGSEAAEVPGAAATVAGGPTRSESARRGVEAVPDSAEVILVHDGARPLATAELFGRVVAAVRRGAASVVPAVPVTDTVRDRNGEVVDRSGLRAVQTPQGFRADVLRSALAVGGDATDEAALVAGQGCGVTMVEGDPVNIKVTTPVDLALARAVLDDPVRDDPVLEDPLLEDPAAEHTVRARGR